MTLPSSVIHLSKKLNIKENSKILLFSPPENYLELIAPVPSGVEFVDEKYVKVDIIHIFVKDKENLYSLVLNNKDKIFPNGIMWVSWPKKSSKVNTNLTEDVIRDFILTIGLVDIKVCSIDDTWSGLKLMYRRENRNF